MEEINMSTTTVEETTIKEDIKDSKSSQAVSETSQGTETKKKPGPKPKAKVEDSTSEKVESKKSIQKETTGSKQAVKKESEFVEEKKATESVVVTDGKVKEAVKKESQTSEFFPAHILQRCPVYRTPSTKGVVLVMISGFVFCNRNCENGFYKVRYNSFERGARTGYVESKYIAFGAKK